MKPPNLQTYWVVLDLSLVSQLTLDRQLVGWRLMAHLVALCYPHYVVLPGQQAGLVE